MSAPAWLYLQSERGDYPLWTVGHYDPRYDKWIAESDHDSAEKAAARVHYLNGGGSDDLLAALEPFASFADAWDRNPIRGLDTSALYVIHSGENAAVFGLADCYTAREAIKRARGEASV